MDIKKIREQAQQGFAHSPDTTLFLLAKIDEMTKLLEQVAEQRLPGLGMSGLQNKIYDLLEKVKA